MPEVILTILPALFYLLLSGGNLPPVLHPCQIKPTRKTLQSVRDGILIKRRDAQRVQVLPQCADILHGNHNAARHDMQLQCLPGGKS
ncbi:hypothetical protein, partial [Lonsdalea quercina]|uniref:hypothetical protein n=1 Tax=Lonsdalea quercina TaxID=71657 RepID=UPI003975D345